MNKNNFLSAIALIIIGVAGSLFLNNYIAIPNFEIITAVTLIAAVFLGGVWSFVVPLAVVAGKDVVMGNNSVLFFTWSAFAVIGLFGWMFRRYESRTQKFAAAFPLCKSLSRIYFGRGLRGILGLTGIGILSSIFFFLYTNFGWWMISNMYPHTPDGLMQAYIMGLPFFKNNLIGNLFFVPVFGMAVMFFKFSLKNKLWNQEKDLILQKK